MRARLTMPEVALAALVLAGCAQQDQAGSSRPTFRVTAPQSGTTCNFKALSQLATHYFPGQEAKTVRDIISAMQSASAYTEEAQDSGFSVMSHIAANITAGNTDVSDASSLTNGLLACMYSDTAALPATFPEDFSVATNPALDGAYAVRGGAADTDYVVFSRPLGSSFSGVGPDSADRTAPWSTMLDSNPAPNRILVYGMPGSTSYTYDWRVVPRNTRLAPPAVVAVCLNPDAGAGETSLLHEEHVGLLPFVHATWLGVPPGCSTPMAARSVSGPLRLASRAARWGLSLFTPAPLSAANSVVPDGLGGTAGGMRSEFGAEQVDTVTLTFTVQPYDIHLGEVIDSVVVRATHATTGATVANVTIRLTAINNNGTPAMLTGDTLAVTNAAGLATFRNLSETKTGGYVLVATGAVGGRSAIYGGYATSDRFNVRP
jgi:hypothetical protein